MTNFEKWRLYNREVTSPDSFINFAFYYAIAATLGRKVWRGPDHRKLFANQYPILVGEPGVGKGLVIKQVAELLHEHKLQSGEGLKANGAPKTNEIIQKEVIQSANFALARGDESSGKQKTREEPLLIPVAANATTFEALTNACAKSTRANISYVFDPKLEKRVEKIDRHASLCFCLEEISSLFHKEAAKVINFLITAYDCGDYTYDTKTMGTDYIKGLCLNFFGGTTPAFVESSFSDKLLSEGFASRTWFIYAPKNRKFSLLNPPLTPEQIAARADISAHIKKLSEVYGEIKFTPEAWTWLEAWWIRSNTDPTYTRPNKSDKLNAYYSRKDIHVQKMAIAMHMAEDATVNELGGPAKPVELQTVQNALAFIEAEEPNMHMALNFEGANPLSKISKKILKFLIKHGPKTSDDIVIEFFSDSKREETHAIIDHLRLAGQITLDEAMLWHYNDKKKP